MTKLLCDKCVSVLISVCVCVCQWMGGCYMSMSQAFLRRRNSRWHSTVHPVWTCIHIHTHTMPAHQTELTVSTMDISPVRGPNPAHTPLPPNTHTPSLNYAITALGLDAKFHQGSNTKPNTSFSALTTCRHSPSTPVLHAT